MRVRKDAKLLDLQSPFTFLLLLLTSSSSKPPKLHQKLKVSSKIQTRGLGFKLGTERTREGERIRVLKVISCSNRVQTLKFRVCIWSPYAQHTHGYAHHTHGSSPVRASYVYYHTPKPMAETFRGGGRHVEYHNQCT